MAAVDCYCRRLRCENHLSGYGTAIRLAAGPVADIIILPFQVLSTMGLIESLPARQCEQFPFPSVTRYVMREKVMPGASLARHNPDHYAAGVSIALDDRHTFQLFGIKSRCQWDVAGSV